MATDAERLFQLADRLGISPAIIGAHPGVYSRYIEAAGIVIDTAAVSRAIALERAAWEKIQSRVAEYNAGIEKLKQIRKNGCPSGERSDRVGAVETNQNKESDVAKKCVVQMADAVAIFQALGFKNAPTWSEQRLSDQIEAVLADSVEEADDDALTKKQAKLAAEWLDAVKKKLEIEIVGADAGDDDSDDDDEDEGDEEEAAPAKKKKAAKKDDEEEEEEEDDEEESDDADEGDDDSDDDDGEADDDSDEEEDDDGEDDDDDEEPAPASAKKKKAAKKAAVAADDDDDDSPAGKHDAEVLALLRRIAEAAEESRDLLKKLAAGGGKKAAEEKPASKPAAKGGGDDDEGGSKGKVADVVAEIKRLMGKATTAEKALSKAELVEKLKKKFPDNDEAALKKRVEIWVPGRLEKEGATVKKKGGKFWLVNDDE